MLNKNNVQGDEWNRTKSVAGIQRVPSRLKAAQPQLLFVDLHEPTGEIINCSSQFSGYARYSITVYSCETTLCRSVNRRVEPIEVPIERV
jgi:hypothetical protein